MNTIDKLKAFLKDDMEYFQVTDKDKELGAEHCAYVKGLYNEAQEILLTISKMERGEL